MTTQLDKKRGKQQALPMLFATTLIVASNVQAENDPNALFPEAVPGECYARVLAPAKFRTETSQVEKEAPTTITKVIKPPQYGWVEKKVEISEPEERIEVVPATYRWVNEQVMVEEPGEVIKVIPAKYEWVTEQVMVEEEIVKEVRVPATYKTVREKVLDKPAHTVWKKGTNSYTKILDEDGNPLNVVGTRRSANTGDIMCLVEVPATYKTVTKRVLDRPETTKQVVIPAKYKNVRKKVLKSPATTRTVEKPAKYKTVRKKVLDTPATTRTVGIPPRYKTIRVKVETAPAETREIEKPGKYETVTTKVMLSEPKMAWHPVLCEVNMTRDNIRRLQIALRDAGHNPGPIDGVIGSRTLGAVDRYQRVNSLLRGGITYETLEKLGVTIVK